MTMPAAPFGEHPENTGPLFVMLGSSNLHDAALAAAASDALRSEFDQQWVQAAAARDYEESCTAHPKRLRDPDTYDLSSGRPIPVFNPPTR
jgi:hypothetical protein